MEGVVRLGELRLETLCEVDGDPVIRLENERAVRGESGGLYLSTGVHGDECAPVWALLEWVASDPPVLHERPVTLFPVSIPPASGPTRGSTDSERT